MRSQADEDQTRGVASKHEAGEEARAFGTSGEFLPNKDAPDGGDEGGALAEGVGDGGAGDTGGDDVEAESDHPNDAAEDTDEVELWCATEVVGVAEFAGAHKDGVHDEVTGEDADAEDGEGDIGREHAGLDGVGVEIGRDAVEKLWIERTHDATSEDREDKTAQRFLAGGLRELAIGETRHDHGEDDESDTGEEQRGIAFGRLQIAFDGADDEGETDADGERYGHAGCIDGDDEHDVRDVEDDAADEGVMDGVMGRLIEIRESGLTGFADAAKGGGVDKAEEQDADGVIPIVEFEAPLIFAGQFLGVGPGAPAEHGDDTEKDGDGKAVKNKHGFCYSVTRAVWDKLLLMKATVFCGVSVDGFIARADGGLDFLDAGGHEPHGYDEFMATVDALVIGRKTYETVLGFGGWAYGERKVFVLSSEPLAPAPEGAVVEHLGGSPGAIVATLEARGIQHIYVDGGVTIQRFLEAGLIQRLIVTRVPILIGRGIPLFGPLPHDVLLKHIATRTYAGGLVQSEYEVV